MPNARSDNNSAIQRQPRRRLLAACVATALGIGGLVTQAVAANIVVQICSDANDFTPPRRLFGLRSSVGLANDGDTIDMTQLPTCTLTLTNGEIPITVNNLTFKAAPGHTVTIDAHKASRIFDHTGTGGLSLSYVSLTNGYSDTPNSTISGFANSAFASGFGGCIVSNGSVSLAHSTISACEGVYSSAIDAAGTIDLTRSIVTGNRGGGSAVVSGGNLSAKYTQINNNVGPGIVSTGSAFLISTIVDGNSGGGIFVSKGSVTLSSSTISNNKGGYYGGGVSVGGQQLTITNSTISGNTTTGPGGGIRARGAQINISNSTIAYNSAGYYGGGIYARNCGSFTIQSSIIANNSVLGNNDYSFSDADVRSCTVTGSNNLVGILSFALPGTLPGPAGLTPLAYHGGTVKTHALLATSHAINAGNNLLNLATDARGSGFPRVVGAAADIGAYERQANDDEIFANGFQ